MSKQYRVVHQQAGRYLQGAVVTREQVESEGHDFAWWIANGAVEQVADAEPAPNPPEGQE